MKGAALRGALSDRAAHDRIHVVEALTTGDAPSTKTAVGLLSAISQRKNVLVVAEHTDAVAWKSLRNSEAVHLIAPGQLNTYDVLISDDVVFTESALQAFLAGAPKGKAVKATATSSEAEAAPVAATEVKAEAKPEPKAEPVVETTAPTPGEDLAPAHIESAAPSVETAEAAPDSVEASADSAATEPDTAATESDSTEEGSA
jgi:large subunit ribosomal protein L4